MHNIFLSRAASLDFNAISTSSLLHGFGYYKASFAQKR